MSSRTARSDREGGRRRARRAIGARLFALIALAACLSPAACGSEVPAGGVRMRPPGPRVVRRLEPADLFPADLDLLVRVDLARMQAALGPALADDLAARALRGSPEAGGDEALVERAIARADVVWIGLRLADLEAGDRVLVTEGRQGAFSSFKEPPPGFRPLPVTDDGTVAFEREEPPPRSGTARILLLGERAVAFISPVEIDSVARVLRDGPDERRGDPVAEGIVSLDLRPRRLSPSLERRFPSIAAIVGGLDRVRASAVLSDDGIRLSAEIQAKGEPAAARALRFLEALRDNVQGPVYVELMRSFSIEQIGETVRIRWTVPAKLVALLAGSGPDAAAPVPVE
ncbi:MAG: hypothetical protein L6Q76_11570 [Polyangiaceae bacterium]|nr:hypothetical protein [Polyangiaceae bacterium]